MKTLVIYLDSKKKNVHKITPKFQEAGYDSKIRFDGRWDLLVQHLTRGRYYSYEIIGS